MAACSSGLRIEWRSKGRGWSSWALRTSLQSSHLLTTLGYTQHITAPELGPKSLRSQQKKMQRPVGQQAPPPGGLIAQTTYRSCRA